MLRGDVRRARRILVAPTRQTAPHQLVALRSVSTNAILQHHDFDYRVDVVSKQPYDGIAKLKRRPHLDDSNPRARRSTLTQSRELECDSACAIGGRLTQAARQILIMSSTPKTKNSFGGKVRCSVLLEFLAVIAAGYSFGPPSPTCRMT
jgi:hypothetical protein